MAERKDSMFSWPGAVAVLLVGWGILHEPAPLETARPAIAKFPAAKSPTTERLSARLWQDPLRVAYAAESAWEARLAQAGGAAVVNAAGAEHEERDGHGDAGTGQEEQDTDGAQDSGEAEEADAGTGEASGHPLFIPPHELRTRIQERIGSGDGEGDGGEAGDTGGTAAGVHILPVMLHGAQYADDQENRLRSRYAVVAALGSAGYQPVQSDALGVVELAHLHSGDHDHPDDVIGLLRKKEDRVLVPFEWFEKERPDKSKHPRVLVLWVDENQMGLEPLTRLANLFHRILPDPPVKESEQEDGEENVPAEAGLKGGGEKDTPNAAMKGTKASVDRDDPFDGKISTSLIGPVSSGTLAHMVEDDRRWPDRDCKDKDSGTEGSSKENPGSEDPGDENPKGEETTAMRLFRCLDMRVISPWSTVGADELGLVAASECEPDLLVPGDVPDNGPQDSPEDAPDDSADDEKERCWRSGIQLRRILPSDDRLAGALVEELGQRGIDPGTRPIALVYEADTRYGRALAAHVASQWKVCPFSPSRAHPYSFFKGLDGLVPGDPGTGSDADPADDHADGRSQLDYLRRLEQVLLSGDRDYAAICIFASDVYDKLLILRALRESFPDAWFLTTDLDARFAHRSESAWTRNLVVVSGLGLELDTRLQDSHPQFRDSYQTAVYLACRQALEPGRHATPAEPRIYEMGRSGPIELGFRSDGTDPREGRAGIPPSLLVLGLALLLLFCVGFPLLINAELRADTREQILWITSHPVRGSVALLLLAAPVVAVIWLMGRDALLDGGEPFVLAEGISVWPTEALRLLCFALAFHYAITAVHRMRSVEAEVETGFHLGDEDAARARAVETGNLTRWQRGRRWWRELWWAVPRSTNTMAAVWLQHRRQNVTTHRLARPVFYVLGLIGVMLLAMALVDPTPPLRPIRGTASSIADRIALSAALIGTFYLVFLVVDVLLRVGRVTREAAASEDWPERALSEARERHGLPPEAAIPLVRMQFLAAWTRPTATMLYYPFIVILVLMLSRHSIFDTWSWPPFIVVTMGSMLVLLIAAGIVTTREAAEARRISLEALNRVRLRALGEGEEMRAEQLQQVEATVRAEHHGAFTSLRAHPLLRGVLIPTTGVGSLALLEFFTRQ